MIRRIFKNWNPPIDQYPLKVSTSDVEHRQKQKKVENPDSIKEASDSICPFLKVIDPIQFRNFNN